VLDTAIKLDKFYANTVYQNDTSFDLHEMREEMNYAGKVAAGVLSLFIANSSQGYDESNYFNLFLVT